MLLELLVRPNIRDLKPYSSARDEYKGVNAEVFLDANENPYNQPFNRYPDPLQRELKDVISPIKQVPASNIFLGNGSDEPIDLLFRIFCRPQIDNVVAIAPTYGMYEVCANINDVEYRKVQLDQNYQMSADKLIEQCDANTKLIFICSPNNPTGNAFPRQEIEKVLNAFQGIVVIDEAYSDFCDVRPFRLDLKKYPNLVVLNTFSKAYGCAAIRLGMAFASEQIIALFNKVKYPYNVNVLTQKTAKEVLADMDMLHHRVVMIKKERELLISAVEKLPLTVKVYPTDANFFIAKMKDADAIYNALVQKGIIVRNRSKVELCGNCLRITVGTKDENARLLAALRTLKL